MESNSFDRRPGIELGPTKRIKRSSRFAQLARVGPSRNSMRTSSSKMLATFVAVAVLYGFDGYFFGGYYGSTAWSLLHQIGGAFGF